MIEVKHLYFKYDKTYVVKDADFTVAKGEKIALFGVNGSGKSSLLKLMNGLIFPQKGTVLFDGAPLTRKNLKNKDFRKKFRTSSGLLFQNPDVMLFNPSVYEELAFGLKQLQCDDIDEKVQYWAEKLHLTALLDKSPVKLSGGEKQRTALASILILEPDFLLLDEPFSSLDPKATGWLIDFLHTLDSAFVVALHNMELAKEIADRVIVLSENHEIIYDGNIHDFFNDREKLVQAGLWHEHSGKGPHSHNF
ncbi:energy-coupling factor ABC transporter ATP-binding protein [Candidatus Sulfidibacterium hydrothermale]|uniref:energy-coupling factor ABC transporter ATP-binding protein n=1 Tax=Candidatus Sulfidibacterium hydrothermale TaxID=2875962 RepID=UPI001F0A70F7|nr:ABC transporter ATP-binding protein [Candidatus Sulfidibacterium hydrothermale]UBM63217.1 energy-coupling factor ABC transporter ATP-binding protein [Candidatus Sulfidibacterium hydrothermale]